MGAYDRCPLCRAQASFEGITVVRGEWLRWMECQQCGTHMIADEHGTLVRTSKPSDGMPKPKGNSRGQDT